jgi:hypothetical protein
MNPHQADDTISIEFRSDSGNVVRRVGDTVRRRPGPWTPAVHELLRYLEAVEFPYSPRVLGFDSDGNEILSYIDGVSGRNAWAMVVPDAGLTAFAQLLRSYHDAVAGFRPATAGWSGHRHDLRDDQLICHGDFGPWNSVWQSGRPVGMVDWDLARPRRRLYDVGYAMEYTVPFRDDAECVEWLAYPSPPDRARRLALFARAYGLASTNGLVDEVIRVQEEQIRGFRNSPTRAGTRRPTGWPMAILMSSPSEPPGHRPTGICYRLADRA